MFVIFIRNSRLVVDEDDLMWFKNKGNYHVLVNQFHGNFRSKTPGCRILIHCSEIQNDSLMHCKGLKG